MINQPLEGLRKSFVHPARMTLAAVLAFIAAREVGLHEVYWAPIAALIVVQSDSNAMPATSWLLLVGTALGVCAGALLATHMGQGVIVLAFGILGMGLLSAAARLDRRANHFTCIALLIVLLAGPPEHAWSRALHRFAEFSTGIVMALLLNLLWHENQPDKGNIQKQ